MIPARTAEAINPIKTLRTFVICISLHSVCYANGIAGYFSARRVNRNSERLFRVESISLFTYWLHEGEEGGVLATAYVHRAAGTRAVAGRKLAPALLTYIPAFAEEKHYANRSCP